MSVMVLAVSMVMLRMLSSGGKGEGEGKEEEGGRGLKDESNQVQPTEDAYACRKLPQSEAD